MVNLKNFNRIHIIFFILLSCGLVSAQTSKKAETLRIEAYCKQVDKFVKKLKSPHLVFADTADYNEKDKPKWRKFASEKALEKFRETTAETYSISYNWLKNGKIIKSNFTLFSPSGDWAEYVLHYFREDGTLAKAEQEMRTFNEDLILIQNFYFDRKGKLQKKTVKYLDLRSKKPKKTTKEFLSQIKDYISQADYYKKLSELPFAKLL
jgi:hypothetical protein